MLSVETLMQEARLTTRGRRSRRTAEDENQTRRISEEIDALPEQSRLCVALRFYEQMRPSNIARILGVSEETVREMLVEASRHVLERLKDADPPRPVRRRKIVLPR